MCSYIVILESVKQIYEKSERKRKGILNITNFSWQGNSRLLQPLIV